MFESLSNREIITLIERGLESKTQDGIIKLLTDEILRRTILLNKGIEVEDTQ